MRRNVALLDAAGAGAGGMQEGAAGAPGAVDNFLGQNLEIVAVINLLVADDFCDARPTTPQANHFVALAQRPDGHGANGRVQPRNITAAGQDGDDARFTFHISHKCVSISIVLGAFWGMMTPGMGSSFPKPLFS